MDETEKRNGEREKKVTLEGTLYEHSNGVIMNSYVEKNGSGENVFLITQYFINSYLKNYMKIIFIWKRMPYVLEIPEVLRESGRAQIFSR